MKSSIFRVSLVFCESCHPSIGATWGVLQRQLELACVSGGAKILDRNHLRIMASSLIVIWVLCIFATAGAFNVQSSPRLGIPMSRRTTAVTKGTSVAGVTGVSLMKLGAGLQRDEEEEFFESDVSVTQRDVLSLQLESELIAMI